MYRLKGKISEDVFIGVILESICVSENTVSLIFQKQISITMQGRYRCYSGKAARALIYDVPLISRRLLNLVGALVKAATIEDDRNLIMYFSNDIVLEILDDSDLYECFAIQIGEKEIIV